MVLIGLRGLKKYTTGIYRIIRPSTLITVLILTVNGQVLLRKFGNIHPGRKHCTRNILGSVKIGKVSQKRFGLSMTKKNKHCMRNTVGLIVHGQRH